MALHQGCLAPQETCGNVWRHFGLSRRKGYYWHPATEARDVLPHPTVLQDSPPHKNCLFSSQLLLNLTFSAEVEEPWKGEKGHI